MRQKGGEIDLVSPFKCFLDKWKGAPRQRLGFRETPF